MRFSTLSGSAVNKNVDGLRAVLGTSMVFRQFGRSAFDSRIEYIEYIPCTDVQLESALSLFLGSPSRVAKKFDAVVRKTLRSTEKVIGGSVGRGRLVVGLVE